MLMALTLLRQLTKVNWEGEVEIQNSSEPSEEPLQPETRESKRTGHLSELDLSWERPKLRQLGRWEALLGVEEKLECEGQFPEVQFQKMAGEKGLQKRLRKY